jgi:hypothetical protein
MGVRSVRSVRSIVGRTYASHPHQNSTRNLRSHVCMDGTVVLALTDFTLLSSIAHQDWLGHCLYCIVLTTVPIDCLMRGVLCLFCSWSTPDDYGTVYSSLTLH